MDIANPSYYTQNKIVFREANNIINKAMFKIF